MGEVRNDFNARRRAQLEPREIKWNDEPGRLRRLGSKILEALAVIYAPPEIRLPRETDKEALASDVQAVGKTFDLVIDHRKGAN